jgi:hypothetical protein
MKTAIEVLELPATGVAGVIYLCKGSYYTWDATGKAYINALIAVPTAENTEVFSSTVGDVPFPTKEVT